MTTEHSIKITLTGGDEPDMFFRGVLKGFEGLGKRATVVWRDEDNLGEIIVDRSWKRHSGTQDREDAIAKADAVANRTINWQFVEFAR